MAYGEWRIVYSFFPPEKNVVDNKSGHEVVETEDLGGDMVKPKRMRKSQESGRQGAGKEIFGQKMKRQEDKKNS